MPSISMASNASIASRAWSFKCFTLKILYERHLETDRILLQVLNLKRNLNKLEEICSELEREANVSAENIFSGKNKLGICHIKENSKIHFIDEKAFKTSKVPTLLIITVMSISQCNLLLLLWTPQSTVRFYSNRRAIFHSWNTFTN